MRALYVCVVRTNDFILGEEELVENLNDIHRIVFSAFW